jgi:hypothetical protein
MPALMDHRDKDEPVFLDIIVEVEVESALHGSANVVPDNRS